jgi:hypothetical protein
MRPIVVEFTAASLVLTLTTTVAFAQTKPRRETPKSATPAPPTEVAPPAPTSLADSLSGDAKSDYEAAKLLYGDGDYGGALVKFQTAYDKAKDPRLLWNIAACEKNLRHYASVIRYVRQYLKDGAGLLSPADTAEGEALLTTIEPFTATLEMNVNEPDAEVFVDDVLVGTAPLKKPVIVDIGVRKIRVVKTGFDDYTKEIPIGGSPKVTLDVALTKVVHEGTLAVQARPGEEVFVDGVRVGMGAWRGVVASGGHTLRVTAPEMRAYQSEISVRDNETRTIAVTLEKEVKPSSGVPLWVWIGGGVLLAGSASVAGYFLFKPDDKQPNVPVGTLDPGSVQASFPGMHFK